MLLGIWKNIDELEDSINLSELQAILKADREKTRDAEMRHNKFMAALKGIDLDKDETATDRVEEIKKRVAAKRAGKTPEQMELESLGIKVETEG